MKKLLPLLLCLSLSIFTVAHAAKLGHTLAPDTETAPQGPMAQQADAKTSIDAANTDEEVASGDDDSIEDASDDKGEDMNDDDSGDAASDENTADDDEADADGGGDEGE